MSELVDLLQSLAEATLEIFWLPVIIWTIIAIPVTLIMRKMDDLSPVYHYHSRIALFLAMPIGLAGSILANTAAATAVNAESAAAKFIVFQSPVALTSVSAPSASIQTDFLYSPLLWIGVIDFVILTGALLLLMVLLSKILLLFHTHRHLNFIPLDNINTLKNYLPKNQGLKYKSVLIAFSQINTVPYTYGWLKTKIVIPSDLKKSPGKLAMAVQHELMHVKHRDYLLNTLLMVIKAFFWFHPLIHYLHRSSLDYREITCDSEVLSSNRHFSRKKYAELLLDFAQRDAGMNGIALNMAVNPSTLKKRIGKLGIQRKSTRYRFSFHLTLVAAGMVVLFMACTDLRDSGITNTPEQVKTDIQDITTASEETAPLVIVNGEVMGEQYSLDMLSKIKPQYIQHIQIYKDPDKATELYGEAGRNGVIEIQLKDSEEAFNDLKSPPPPSTGAASTTEISEESENPDESFFVAVENMPVLKGGLASLQKNIRYPQRARKAGVEGRVIVQFIIDKEGNVEDPKIIRGIGAGCDEEALRVVRQAKFEPGKQRGQPVRVQYSLPIIYRLQ